MHSFEVIGGQKLKGEIVPQGAKNEALQIISAVLLTPEKVTITNIPDILDVNLLISEFPSALADALNRALHLPEVLVPAGQGDTRFLAANL